MGNNVIINCYNTGEIVLQTSTGANKYIGGLAGYFRDGYTSNSYNIGRVRTDYVGVAGIGGIIGREGPAVNNIFFLKGTVDKKSYPGEEVTDTKSKSEKMLNFLNQGNDIWVRDTNNINSGYPILKRIN